MTCENCVYFSGSSCTRVEKHDDVGLHDYNRHVAFFFFSAVIMSDAVPNNELVNCQTVTTRGILQRVQLSQKRLRVYMTEVHAEMVIDGIQ